MKQADSTMKQADSTMKQAVCIVFLAIGISVGNSAVLNAQPAIVSEYYNDNFTQEWTEILVVQDNLDMRGWVVTDNNATQTSRQGGVRFRNIPYWQHVRAGTIIGIWHRDYLSNTPQDFDTSMADGRVMLAKNDTRFFDPYTSADVQFPDAPMNLAQEGDIMEILDANENHIHGLGHRATPGSYWIAMQEPKLNTPVTLLNGQSNRAFPGATLSQYNGPHGAPLSEGCLQNITRTLPNKSCTSSVSNWEFWHSLRMPQWSMPRLQITVNATNVQLSWNAAIDPYPQDGIQGYLIIRDSSSQGFLPEQGRIYQIGERVGSAVVIAQVPSMVTSYTDPLSLSCGISYTYRVFAYRFAQDDEYGPLPSPQSTRGRQYNTISYASATALKQVEQGPRLQTSGPTSFCEGNSVLLNGGNIPTGYSAQWLVNGAAIVGATNSTYRAQSSGEYRLRLQRPDGCFVLSDSIVVTVYPTPTALIQPSANVQLCPDSTVTLVAQYQQEWRYQWFRDGTSIAGATQSSYITQNPGSYYVEVTNEYGCTARSTATVVEVLNLQVQVFPSNLSLATLSGCQSSIDTTITLINQSNTPITITQGIETQRFRIVSPSIPFELKAGERRTVTVRFAPATAGTWIDSIGLQLSYCNKVLWTIIRGTKSGTTATLHTDSTVMNFGIVKRCNGQVTTVQDSIRFYANGDLTIQSVSIGAPWQLAPGFTIPRTIQGGTRISIPIVFAPVLDQPYSADAVFHYTSAQCTDSVKVPLRGILTTPYVGVSAREIIFPTLDSCTTLFADTTVVLYNTSLTRVEIPQLLDPQIQIVDPLPSPLLIIEPRDSLRIRLRYSPDGYTLTQQRLPILFGDRSCTQSELLIVKGTRTGTSVLLDKQSLELRQVLLCRDTTPIIRTFELTTESIPPGARETTVISVSSSASWLSTSLTPSTIPTGTHQYTLEIDLRQLQPGTSSAAITIRTEPCSRVLTLSVTVEADDILTGFRESNDSTIVHVDFGSVAIGTQVTRVVTVRNLSRYPLRYIISTPLPPSLTADASALFSLDSLTSAPLQLTYTPTTEGTLNDTLILQTTLLCTKFLYIVVSGKGVRDTTSLTLQNIELIIPESHVASPGERVRYTIEYRGVTVPVRLDTLKLPVRFNRSMLFVEQVETGNATSSSRISGMHTDSGYTIEMHDVELRSSGILAVLEGTVLLGNSRQTWVTLDTHNIHMSNPQLHVTSTVSGLLRLADKCNIDQRLLEIGSNPLFALSSDRDRFRFTINQIETAHARILLYNTAGQVLTTVFDGVLTRGTHHFDVATSHLPASIVIAVYSSGQFVRSLLAFPR